VGLLEPEAVLLGTPVVLPSSVIGHVGHQAQHLPPSAAVSSREAAAHTAAAAAHAAAAAAHTAAAAASLPQPGHCRLPLLAAGPANNSGTQDQPAAAGGLPTLGSLGSQAPFRLDSFAELEALLNGLSSPSSPAGELPADLFQLHGSPAAPGVPEASASGAAPAAGSPLGGLQRQQLQQPAADVGAGADAAPRHRLVDEVPGAMVRLVSGIAEDLKQAAAAAAAGHHACYSWLVALTKME